MAMTETTHQMTSSNSSSRTRIPVAAPDLGGRETEYVLECLKTTWISSTGRFISEFEKAFAEFCGVKHAVATNNGTTALHLALVALDLKPGDEVIVPSLTYIASANAVRYCNGRPVFVDNDLETFNIDAAEVAAKITPRTRGIMPVHLYGHPVDLDPILEIAKRHGLFVIEDAAEAVGAKYRGHRIGGMGNCATFSFFGNKIITTGEGGMVTTNDDQLAARLRLFRGQGVDPHRRYWFPVVGNNYRMTNIAAAIGLAQIERIDFHMRSRTWVAQQYDKRLAFMRNQIALPQTKPWAEHAFWMYTIRLLDSIDKQRDQVMQELDMLGIETRPVFYPMHVMPPYQEPSGSYPRAELCGARGINLPTHANLTEQDLDYIVAALETVLKKKDA
jgi:perosamine synthetase